MDESVGMGVSLNMGISVFCLGFLDTCSEDRMRVRRIGIEDRKEKLHSLCVDESEQSRSHIMT